MFKELKQLYCMVMCLISAVALMVTLIVCINAVTELIIPEYKHRSALLKYQSNDKYLYHKQVIGDDTKHNLNNLLPQEIDKLRILARDNYMETIKGDVINTLISCIGTLIVSLIFFIAHWKLYKYKQEKISIKNS